MKVHFLSRYEAANGWADEDNIDPYISVANPEPEIAAQQAPDEVVIPLHVIRIAFDYPLSRPTVREYRADTPNGFTRAHLARCVSRGYQDIYAEEAAAVGDPGLIPGMYNRRTSYGPHGIWGHDIEDLDLVEVAQDPKDPSLFHLDVDS